MTRINGTNSDKTVKFEECTFNTSGTRLQRCLGNWVKKKKLLKERHLIKTILTILKSKREKEFKRKKKKKYKSINFQTR